MMTLKAAAAPQSAQLVATGTVKGLLLLRKGEVEINENPARGTPAEYQTTLKKWTDWGCGVPLEQLGRKEICGFLNWVYEQAVAQDGTNAVRTSNKARDHLRTVISWAWEEELIETPPRFPKPREQRDVAGRHYLTKAEINALYFSTHKMQRPRGWGS